MCGCIGHAVCGYHTELITDLIERLATADHDEARSLRGELAAHGIRADIVRRQIAKQEASR